jgi:2-oxoglutarate dehydrogenase E2 component (dihydrolipoamide succinyltransferase)
MAIQVIMPQLGESVVEGTVTHWMKQEGETVQEMEALLEVETDKVTTDAVSYTHLTLPTN